MSVCFLVGVDTSRPALDLARQNAALNGIAEDTCSFEQQDVSDFMKQALADGRRWDLVRRVCLAAQTAQRARGSSAI